MNPTSGMHNPTPSILVIEDDEFTASLLRFVLERQHMQVTRVADGRSAITLIDDAPAYDAVVLDLLLPQINGMEVLKRMQQHPDWETRPVIVLSALDDGSEIARAFAAGASDYLTKPFNPEELLARLDRLLQVATRNPRATRA
jgi:DNA-binding response OmpR family regulator